MGIAVPKFHNKASLYAGAITGFILAGCSIVDMFISFRPYHLFPFCVGFVLGIHCLDMVRYYKKHRIVKIEKTETHRIVHKEVVKPNRLFCFGNALKIVWAHNPFKVWVFICTIGIGLGLYAGIGMTNLVVLIAIACLGWAMETANTGIEILLDIVNPAYSDKVKIVKDLYGAVPAFIYSAYVISWLILVSPSLYGKITGS